MQKRVAVSCGHNPDKPGYAVGTISEYSEMVVLAGLVCSYIQRAGHKGYIIGTGSLHQKVADINDLKVDCAIELHLNAANEKAVGYETLYFPGSVTGERLAKSINSSMDLVLVTKNRGVKEGWYRMEVGGTVDYFLKRTNCTAAIFEMYFLDNSEERARYLRAYNILDKVAARISYGILNFLGVEVPKYGFI